MMRLYTARQLFVVIVLIGLVVSLAYFQLVRSELTQAQANYRGGPLWLANQLQFELHRMTETLALFALGDTGVTPDTVNRQFDILWSRWDLSQSGSSGAWFLGVDAELNVLGRLEVLLLEHEAAIVGITQGDAETARMVHAAFSDLKPDLRALSVEALNSVTQVEASVRESIVSGSNIIQITSYCIVGVSVLICVIFYLDSRGQAKRAREKTELLQQAQTGYKAKSEFIATLNHEFKTPLTTTMSSISLLKVPAVREDPEKVARIVELAVTGCHRLKRMIDRLFDLEIFESGNFALSPDNIDLIDVIHASYAHCQELMTEKSISIDEQIEDVNFQVFGDTQRLKQLFEEVIENAIKFSTKQNKIEIDVSQIGTDALIKIKDRGQGIPIAFQEAAFERFTQADSSDKRYHGGTGNGLFIAKKIAEAHEGRIWVKARDGGGTIICIRLPLLAHTKLAMTA